MSIPEFEHYDLLDQLAEEFAARFRRGEHPALKEYTDRYPELADEIRELFPAVVKVERAKALPPGEEESGDARTTNPPQSNVGDYRILREIGHGGMGVVYEAEQVSLGRRVALKMLSPNIAREPRMLERFRREARAAARLHHTNIVPVFDVGRDGDICYYAMQFIQGQGLDLVYDEIRRLRGRDPDEGSTRSEVIRMSRMRVHAAAASPAGVALDGLTDRAGIGQVVHSLLTGRFDPGAAPAAEVAAHVELHPTEHDSIAAESLSVESGATSAVGELAPSPHLSPSPSANADQSLPSSALTSAVLPGGTQISSVGSRGFKYARSVARIGLQAALGLAYAHARGVVHRDIKPSNLLLDTEGVVWITDFGLAKSDGDRLTQTGDILGTLRYMAPERFRGEADVRSDIYALGLTLYELLTVEPAFGACDRLRLIEQVKAEDPIAPRLLDRRVPRDLETIILTAIDKDAKRRYPTADALAEDLRRFLDDEPILARRQSYLERDMRWARRHPGIASTGAVVTMALVLAAGASLVVARRMASLAETNERTAKSERDANVRARAALKNAEANHRDAESQRERAERNLYIARIGQAESSLRLYDSATARALLDQCIPESGGLDRRGWEWFYLDQWCTPELRKLKVSASMETHALALSPDGRFLLVGCKPFDSNRSDGHPYPSIYVIDLKDGKVRHELAGHGGWVLAVGFRPDGKRFATAGDEGIKVWDSDTGQSLRHLRRFAKRVLCLRWSPDGQRIASADRDGMVQIWDPETGDQTARIRCSAEQVAWSPDGTRIATAGPSTPARIWAAADQEPSGPVLSLGGEYGICWAPDGRRLAGIGNDGWMTVWDTASGQVQWTVKQLGEMRAMAFSPDGKRLATGGTAGIIRLYDAGSGRERAALFTGCENVIGLAFDRDGRRVFAAGRGMGGVKIFDSDRDPRGRGVTPWLEQLGALAFVGESQRLHGIGWQGGHLASPDFSAGRMRYERDFPVTTTAGWPRGDFAFTADGRRLAAPLKRDPGVVGIWDVALGRLEATIHVDSTAVTAVAFSRDGKRMAIGANGGSMKTNALTIWDLSSIRVVRTFDLGPRQTESIAFARDGDKIAAGGGAITGGGSGWVTVWDAQTGDILAAQDRIGLVKYVSFHPDGTLLAIADFENENVHLWDIVAGTLITRPGPLKVSCVSFTPDGRRMASLGYDGSVHLADPRTGETVLVLRSLGPPPGSAGWTPRMAFSADGSRIAAHRARFLNLWEVGRQLDPPVEPKPDDVAGWLRLSRTFATQGDGTRALAAFERAFAIPTEFPEPWIRHGLAEGIELQQAAMAFAKAFTAPCDDPLRWLVCAASSSVPPGRLRQ